jgi:hypothetical protein
MITTKQIYDRLISSGLADKNTIVGCSDSELYAIVREANRELPEPYREFMAAFGHNAGRFLRDIDMFYPGVLLLRSVAEEIVADYEEFEIKLPASAFVFAMRQKEQFMFFDDAGNDPPVKYYMSGQPAITIIARSFWDLIESELNQAETNYAVIKGTVYEF